MASSQETPQLPEVKVEGGRALALQETSSQWTRQGQSIRETLDPTQWMPELPIGDTSEALRTVRLYLQQIHDHLDEQSSSHPTQPGTNPTEGHDASAEANIKELILLEEEVKKIRCSEEAKVNPSPIQRSHSILSHDYSAINLPVHLAHYHHDRKVWYYLTQDNSLRIDDFPTPQWCIGRLSTRGKWYPLGWSRQRGGMEDDTYERFLLWPESEVPQEERLEVGLIRKGTTKMDLGQGSIILQAPIPNQLNPQLVAHQTAVWGIKVDTELGSHDVPFWFTENTAMQLYKLYGELKWEFDRQAKQDKNRSVRYSARRRSLTNEVL
ncbi:hypothetical protein F4677DRAFT_449148 [Hypoxylon crocopeplum]|nr:hypothetical protein F4677DRAFT_449148 [Hypoxylon crocopeplum]